MTGYFESLTSEKMAALVGKAQRAVCYAGPGLQEAVADALITKAKDIGTELITVCVDFDERVFRMGFGEVSAVENLRAAGISVTSRSGLRMGLLVVDDQGYAFAPTALLLEGEKQDSDGMNAIRMHPAQAKEAMARLSPAAKAVAMVLAKTAEERTELAAIAVEVVTVPVTDAGLEVVKRAIVEAPLIKFDVARQVRVYNTYLQYVEVNLKNASIDKRRVTIPASILALGSGDDELQGRLKSTFDLIDKKSSISSKPLNDKVEKLRKSFTPSLGHPFKRVMLKSAKPVFEERITALRAELLTYQADLLKNIDDEIAKSKKAIVAYYFPLAVANTPDEAIGLFGSDVKAWLQNELDKSFPTSAKLVDNMVLEVDYRDVTYETLQDPKFLDAVRKAFPGKNWDKALEEYRASGEVADERKS